MGKSTRKKKVIRASGGIVERNDDEGLRIAIVRRKRSKRHRRRRGRKADWVLPKGKPGRGEKTRATALREVREETGCKVKLNQGPELKTKYATVRGKRKIVTFFPMRFKKKLGPPDASEIAKVKWLAPAAAIKRLTYDTERKIVRRIYPDLRTKRAAAKRR